MAYTTIDKPDDYFNTVLYTGTGSARTITGVGFQPDWVWVKDRTSVNSHYLYDVLRGNNLNLFTNDTSAEVNVTTGQNGGGVGSQASDGFTIVAGVVGTDNVNTSGNLYASWNWKANGAGVSNTDGTISSTVSANTTSGFSIVTFTSTGSTSTVGHGLGSAPAMIIGKRRDSTSTWTVGHQSLGWTKFLRLEDTTAVGTETGWWNNTNPTSTVFTHGTNWNAGTWVAYCFAEKKGFSKFGSYTGNGSADGSFIYTGFKPAFVMVKNTGSAESWQIRDNKRDPFNVTKQILYPNLSSAEATSGGGQFCDLLSNGFKWRGSDAGNNSSGATFIYMAFASQPFTTSTGIPATAR